MAGSGVIIIAPVHRLVLGPPHAGLRGAARDLGALRRGDLRVRCELLLPVQDVVLLAHLLDPGGVITVY